MADQLLSQVQDLFQGQIDFKGQQLAELISNVLLIISGIVAFVVGLVQQDIYLTLWVGLAGALVTALLIVPPWPFYNRHPVNWLPKSAATIGTDVKVDGKKVN